MAKWPLTNSNVLDVEITAAIQNKGAFSLTTCCSLYEAVWKTPVSWEGLIHALVLLLCEGKAASSRPKWKQGSWVSVRMCLVPWKSQGRKGLIPGGSPMKQNEKMQSCVSTAQGGECRDASNVWHCLCAPEPKERCSVWAQDCADVPGVVVRMSVRLKVANGYWLLQKRGGFAKQMICSVPLRSCVVSQAFLSEPKKALFFLYFVLTLFFSCLRHFSKEVGMAVFSWWMWELGDQVKGCFLLSPSKSRQDLRQAAPPHIPWQRRASPTLRHHGQA